LFSTHYRKPITFSKDRLNTARLSLKRIDQFLNTLKNIKEGRSYAELDQVLYDIKHGFTTAMDDDLNISAAMASLFKNIKKINILALEKKIAMTDASKILDAFRKIDKVLGFLECAPPVRDSEVQKLIETRNQARLDHNWALADRIRDQLEARGVLVQDGKVE
jgi:cysteinyl-tRNA synthetase